MAASSYPPFILCPPVQVLESSLDDLHRAQQTQVDLDKLQHENRALKKEYSELSRRATEFASKEDLAELKKQNRVKDAEIDKLQSISDELRQRGEVGGLGGPGSPYTAKSMNHEKQMLIYKIQQLEV